MKEVVLMVFAVMLGTFLLASPFVYFIANMEARSYRKFCDTPVTWVDAVFLDLRIDECGCDND
jgi:hypothetical protein